MPVKYRSVAGRAMRSKSTFSSGYPTVNFGGGYESSDGGTSNLSFLGRVDVGNPWLMKRDLQIYTPGTWLGTNFAGSDAVCSLAALEVPPHNVRSDAAVKGDGTTAVARSTPNSPLFSAAQFLGELRNDGLPSPAGVQLWRERAKALKAAGSEYLNIEFGWRPFVADLQSLARAVKKTTQHVNDFTSKSESNIRVGYSFPGGFESTESFMRPFVVLPVDTSINIRCDGSMHVESGEKTWFKGAYTYYAPAKGPLARAASFERHANQLLGTRLTPDTVWNLAPWSWALDWFGNTGDIMHNLSTVGHDGLLLKYGYIMSHTKTDVVINAQPSWATTAASVRWIRETKKRFPASPYFGFGAVGELNATQLAILGALGLSRGPK